MSKHPSSRGSGHMRGLTPDEDLIVASAYLAGEPPRLIAPRFGISRKAIYNSLKRTATPIRLGRGKAQEGYVLKKYAAGVSTRDIATATGVSLITVRRLAARAGLAKHPIRRHYHFDESYFDRIDTPEKARWLGFIAADGCVSDRGSLCVALQADDAAHLDALRQALGHEVPIRYQRGYCNMRGRFIECRKARVAFWSQRLVAALASHGIVPRKTHVLQPWNGPEPLQRFWWAGMIDGDGWCHWSRNGKAVRNGAWYVGLGSASLVVMQAYAVFARNVTGCACTLHYNGSTHVVKVGGLGAPQDLVRLFYGDLQGSIPLARKMQAAAELLALSFRRTPRHFGRRLPEVPQVVG